MRFLADENFNNHIVRALLLQQPHLDLVRVQDVGLAGKADAEVLAWALAEQRILLTHDVNTIPAIAIGWLKEGRSIPAIFFIRQDAPIQPTLVDLRLIEACSNFEEWAGQLHYLPL